MTDRKERTQIEPLVVWGIEVQAFSPPHSHLVFSFQLYNDSDVDRCVLRTWARCILGDELVAEGDLLRVSYAPAFYAIIASRSSHPAEIYVPLSRVALAKIEDRRGGIDLKYRLYLHVTMAPIIVGEPPSLGAPWEEMVSTSRHNGAIEDRIPQSDWLRHLERLGWDETWLVELPVGRLKSICPQATKLFEEAQGHYRMGDWRKTLASCNDILEALAWTKTDSGASQADLTKLRLFFDETRKGDALNGTLKEFRTLLHLGRHQQTPDVEITRADAMFALHFTAGFIRYIVLK